MDNIFSIDGFIENLFSQSPKPPCSVRIQLSNPANKLSTLMTILLNGAKYLYGPSISPKNLTQEQFDFLQYYFNSMGYVIRYKKIFLDDNETILQKVDIWFDELKKQTTCDGRTIII
jgi:hypothetical protein